MKKAVVLFNLGGPDKLESVEPFLFNLFNDSAIISIPSIFRYPLAKFISKRRAPIAKNIKEKLNGLPIQGGLDPRILLTNKERIKKSTENYLNIFKDYPYIFNLGHGVLPETKPETIEYIIQLVRNKK